MHIHASIIMYVYIHRSIYLHVRCSRGKAQRKRKSGRPLLPTYPPAATAARGPNLSALRPRPAPIAAAALDRRHESALRDGPARPSLQRTADERARRRRVVIRAQPSVGVLMVVLYVLATGYWEYSHLQYAAVRSCHSPPRPAAAAVPAHLQFASGWP